MFTRFLSKIALLLFPLYLIGCATTGAGTTTGKKGDGTSDDFLSEDAIKISQVKRGVQVRLQELLLFESGKSSVKPESGKLLDQVATIIKEKTKNNIAIEGHTDNVGTKAFNIRLSSERAEAIKIALVSRGVDTKRLRVAGLDFQNPVADNGTEQGRAKNRRVEIFLLDEKIENVGGQSAFGGLLNAAAPLLKGISSFFKSLF